jgi:sugar-specific transcriptional regulator TrmB
MEEALKTLNLSNNESKIYLELLKMGTSKVNEIAKRLNLPRTTVYNILDSLISKGFVSYVIKSGIKYFESTDPQRLLLKEEEKLNKLKSIIPELEKIKQTIGEKPMVEIYEGVEGMKSIIEQVLRMPKGNTLYAYNNADLYKYLGYYFPNYVKRRRKKGIYAKVIVERCKESKKYRKKGEKILLKMRFYPKRFDSNVFIFENKVALLTFSKEILMGVLIENESIANTQREVFNILWKLSK